MAHEGYGSTALPDGSTRMMSSAEIAIEYPRFPEEVHDLVGRILDASEDRITAVHSLVDTPILAVQSVAMNIGRRLPEYDHSAFPDVDEAGETKQIERADTFAIAEGPIFIGNRILPRFTTVLERVVAHEPVEESEPEERGRLARALFHMAAGAR